MKMDALLRGDTGFEFEFLAGMKGNRVFADCDAFHATWVATVINLDWPSKQSTAIADGGKRVIAQKSELLAILDRAQKLGINAVIFQVSPTADAFLSILDPAVVFLSHRRSGARIRALIR